MEVAQLFVEPETAEGQALHRRFAEGDVSHLPEPERETMAAMLASARPRARR